MTGQAAVARLTENNLILFTNSQKRKMEVLEQETVYENTVDIIQQYIQF